MGILSEIKGLGYKQGMLFAIGLFGIVAAGFLIVFEFRPELIEKYDILKIIFLSIALTMPLVVINLIILILHIPNNEQADKLNMLGAAMFFNVFAIYAPLLICYLFSLRFRWFLGMVAGLEGFYLITGWIHRKKSN